MTQATVKKISGPLVIGVGLEGTKMYELVHVGKDKLFGEVIEIKGKEYSIQVYEDTEGVTPGDPVEPTGMPLSVELGPGLIRAIYDGVQRPLDKIQAKHGNFIVRGAQAPALDRDVTWHFVPVAKPGDKVAQGDVLGTVQESDTIQHRIMVPPGMSGTVREIRELDGNVETVIAVLDTESGEKKLDMIQRWPVRLPRPIKRRLTPVVPLVTGQRILDMFFPIAKGGTACVPGPFGSGKTVVQHQLAKWSDTEIVVYVGCGERGNEMTDVLLEFPHLVDPKTGKPLMERTVLVANTSNMPVAAREASVFTGITMAEYFRDMGYNVAMLADSTSRWAEAMREISGRLGEMPGEEGYPAYLTSRIAGFYERAGYGKVLGSDDREGSVTLIGAVSPPGGDLSEPVVQATLRVVRVFWGLDDKLAFQRHFPAINWLTSYSLYQKTVDDFGNASVRETWQKNRTQAMALLKREAELEEIVRLVGVDALGPADRLTMQAAKMIREDFLHQNAFDDIDTFTSLEKQFMMLDAILEFYHRATEVIKAGVPFDRLLDLEVLEDVSRAKLIR
ncbi:MAG TPA: V-type ATP synthase subunit A, partial [Planctomycetota bacterium]|nr:V-type ATP synthase subunit A [Planctomycetota bacterium]